MEQFQSLAKQFDGDLCWRSILLISVSFGLRISEVLGLKSKDVDRLQKTISIERGVVKQICDSVKSDYSARSMAVADELMDVLKLWRQTTQFASEEYGIWLDSTGSPIGVQKQTMRHSDIRTTRNVYDDAITADMRQAQAKVAALALPKSLN